jgi:predicted heme/steroid binding protein
MEVFMFRKISAKAILICVVVVGFVSLSSAADTTKAVAKTNDTLISLTIADLAKYDGKNGNKAYVAVDSVIYDVSTLKSWKNGEHKMGVKAGLDQSEKIMKSPHGKGVMKKVKVVGKLIPTVATAVTPAPAAK